MSLTITDQTLVHSAGAGCMRSDAMLPTELVLQVGIFLEGTISKVGRS